MKILHVTPSYLPAWHLGGVVQSISQLCQGLSRLGHEVTVFTTDSGKDQRMAVPVNQKVKVSGVNVYYFKTDYSLRYAYSQALKQACDTSVKNFDIVHVTSFWCYPGIPAIDRALRHRVPYLVSVRGTLRRAALNHKLMKKWLYFHAIEKRNVKRAAAIHYTAAMERELDAFHGFSVPSFILPNGFNITEFQEMGDSQEAKRILGVPPGHKVITFLGRLNPVKALDVLIRAMAEPSLKEQAFQLLLAGPDDGVEASLRLMVNALNLKDRVRFLGKVDSQERQTLLAASDILALVSRDENFGNSAVEAMLAGVPVLLSQHVGISREVLADGAGVVVPLSAEAIAQGLRSMLSDPQRLRAMGKIAADSSRGRYDIALVAQKMASAYENILTGRRSPGLGWSEN